MGEQNQADGISEDKWVSLGESRRLNGLEN